MKVTLILFLTQISFLSLGQFDSKRTKFLENFPIEELIKGEWRLLEVEIEGLNHNDSTSIVSIESGNQKLEFTDARLAYHSDTSFYQRYRLPAITYNYYYEIEKDTITDWLYLLVTNKKGKHIYEGFLIESYSFNELVLVNYSGGIGISGIHSKTTFTYRRNKSENLSCQGVWWYTENFNFYQYVESDTAEHVFYSSTKNTQTQDSLIARYGVSRQLELFNDETYSSDIIGRVVASFANESFMIDEINQRLYFYMSAILVYDFYRNSANDLVLKLNHQLTQSYN